MKLLSSYKKIKLVYALLLLCIPCWSYASFIIQYSNLYHTWQDDGAENFSYSRMTNGIFIGASFDKGSRLYIGPSYHMYSKSHTAGSGSTASELSVTAFGAEAIFFLDAMYRWKLNLTYNFALSGDRTLAGVSQKVDGSGYLIGFGYQLPLSKHFWVGGSLSYRSTSISKYTVSTTTTEVTQGYTDITPLLEFSLRFN